MIHILHVLTSLRLGGAERVIGDLVARTDRTRFRHTVAYLHPPHELADQLRESGAGAVCLNAPTHRGWIAAARALRPILREKKPDLIQTVSFDGHLTARLAGLGSGTPQLSWLVSMEYDPESVRAAGWPRRSNLVRKWIDTGTAKLAGARFVACSDSVRRSNEEQLGIARERMDVIFNPVDPETVRAEPEEVEALRRSLALPVEAYVYFTVGRMDAAKDHDTLLRAFARTAAAQPNAFAVLLGHGALETVLKARAQALGVADRVRFVASAPRIAPFLALADVFVFPSLLEGLPVSLLEAMLAGLPSIASDIDPHAEVMKDGETGLIVPRGSDEALAAAMERLYGDVALRARLGAAARAEAEAKFTTDVIVPQWEKVYARLAAPRRSPA
ncbi:MAG TPA: glycosyltransferase [Allosphingosinicella sp.]